MDLVRQGEVFGVDKLIAGLEIPQMIKGARLASGQGVLKRGSILTLNEDGEYVLIANATDLPEGVLTDDTDTNIDTMAQMYQQGHFNRAELIFGEGITDISEITRSLRTINIMTSEVN